MNIVTKKDLRERILTLLRNQREEQRLKKSALICSQLINMSAFKKAATILFYMPFDGEVNTIEMITLAKKLGKKIALPRIMQLKKTIVPTLIECLDSHLEVGPYGIQQPKDTGTNALKLDALDMVVVPGIAFDKKNYRLGRGSGYYDRFLSKLSSHIPTVGLAFDFQIVEKIPQQERHDMAVSHVLLN